MNLKLTKIVHLEVVHNGLYEVQKTYDHALPSPGRGAGKRTESQITLLLFDVKARSFCQISETV